MSRCSVNNHNSILCDSGPWVCVPLYAEGSSIDTDVVQTGADRFHRSLLNMTEVVQELRAVELEQQHDELTLPQTSPKRSFVLPHMMRCEWAELMHELQILQSSFTRILFGDQLNAVRDFEIASRIEQRLGEDGELVPTDIEYVQSHSPELFLGSTFLLSMEGHC